jgi:hypothetical protein
VTLRVAWPPEDAEPYVALDPREQVVAERRESMRVSWFATAGTFEHDRTGRAADELVSFTGNGWTAPDEPGAVGAWVVLRDARGGVAFAAMALTVR